jgi:hypothetical protein
MLIPLLILFAAVLVLIVTYVLDDAMRVVNGQAGLPPGSGLRWSKRIAWTILVIVLAQLVLPKSWFEPRPVQMATYGPDSLWTGADTARLIHLDKERRDLVRYGRELVANTAHYLGPQGTIRQITMGQQ